LPPAAAKFYIEASLGTLILRSKINVPSKASRDYFAQSPKKDFLNNPAQLLKKRRSAYKIYGSGYCTWSFGRSKWCAVAFCSALATASAMPSSYNPAVNEILVGRPFA
jgi:hypothetical protein